MLRIDITITEPLGEGAQAVVWKGICYGIPVCVKELKIPEDNSGVQEIENFRNEVLLFSSVCAPVVFVQSLRCLCLPPSCAISMYACSTARACNRGNGCWVREMTQFFPSHADSWV